jgi:hypothetical protein
MCSLPKGTTMKFPHQILVLLCTVLSQPLCATIIPYTEDIYSMQAPQEIVDLTEQAAQYFEFTDSYEVVVPKKAGITFNPWNMFTTCGINSLTKNPFILVNSDWFLQITPDEQLFLLGRNFLMLKYGTTPWNMKVLPYAFILTSMMLIVLLFWLLGKTRLAAYHKWVRVLIAWIIVTSCNVVFTEKLSLQLSQYLAFRHNSYITNMVVHKTGDKDAAIKALELLDTSVKRKLDDGELFFAPYYTTFENQAKELKK